MAKHPRKDQDREATLINIITKLTAALIAIDDAHKDRARQLAGPPAAHEPVAPYTPTDEGHYAIPGPPPVERRVTNGVCSWVRAPDGHFQHIGPNADFLADPAFDGCVHLPEPIGWADLLVQNGRGLDLVPLDEHEQRDAEIYGPPGARWGDPDSPCPAFGHGCRLGFGHIGPHRGESGQQVWLPTQPGPVYTVEGERADPCDCGNPAQHKPTCPRFPGAPGHPAEWERGLIDGPHD